MLIVDLCQFCYLNNSIFTAILWDDQDKERKSTEMVGPYYSLERMSQVVHTDFTKDFPLESATLNELTAINAYNTLIGRNSFGEPYPDAY